MTTCAVDYGEFTYMDRRTNEYTAKSFFYGPTYLKVYFANEKLSKNPGLCRVLTKDFVLSYMQRNELPFKLLSSKEDIDYYDFYWMLGGGLNNDNLENFKSQYQNLTQSVYENLGNLIYHFANQVEQRT
jgi:hypothetical protein